ncbi:gamma-aminobutyraldehyde dehydrogenase [Limnochorda pilosa]|uniref:Salicylaldehyde dehydrogenase n=1 Tax=Limnochorda pilosa TaxID=1555112 RepID=A0A0K2SLC8_LIMPI|nr:gamma-aminobutyraldehyde dehydrogenase [Limnochorda pilosa]BAS27926.1 gamma-aminobutyraldehyde dehydrogenase [Limnochorda pilosa]
MERNWQLWINGQPETPARSESELVLNPATAEPIARVPKGSEEDVERAVQAAHTAAEGWERSTPGERSLAIWRLADRIEEHGEELARLESLNVGKPLSTAREEIPFIVDNLRFFAGSARTLGASSTGEYLTGYTSMTRREPIGVVASIAPWNYPLMMAAWKIGPALAAGNTVVLKPSEQTPLTALRLAELAADFFPPGVLNVITGHGEPVGAALAAHPKVRMVSLTGDVATGKEVARAAAANLKRVHLELGGKAPVLVFDDADLEAVVEGIRMAGFTNSGQDCTAACRIYASGAVYEQVVERLARSVATLRVGDPQEDGVEMGPVITEEHRRRVAGFVDRARSAGHMEVLTGGRPAEGRGFYYLPTVVAGARQEDEIVRREVFGPVVTATRFTDEDEAIRWANDTEYGLAASVWTAHAERAMKVARLLKFGTVWVNSHFLITSEMPHGGFKQSGYGKDMSVYAVEEYTQIKHVMVKSG